MNTTKKSIVQLSVASILLGFGAVFVVFIDLNPVVIAFYRLLIATILFAMYLRVNRETFRISSKGLLFACLAGMFFGLDLATWNISIVNIGPGIATILNSLQVFFMALFGAFLYRDKLSSKLLVSLIISFIGVVLLCSNEVSSGTNGFWGVAIGIISGGAFAGSMLFLKKASQYKQHSVANIAFYSSIAGAISTGLYAGVNDVSFMIHNTQSLIMILVYGGIVHVVSWFLMAKSLPHIPVSIAGLILCFEPVVVFFVDVSFLDKHISALQYIGAIITICAIYFGTQPIKNNGK